MYITKDREGQIIQAAERIKELATLETCGLPDDIKKKIKLWVMWFDVEADKILSAMEGRK